MRPASGGEPLDKLTALFVCGRLPSSILPATRVQFGLGAVLQYSDTPSLRAAGFEDEDENEAPGEAMGALTLVFYSRPFASIRG